MWGCEGKVRVEWSIVSRLNALPWLPSPETQISETFILSDIYVFLSPEKV